MVEYPDLPYGGCYAFRKIDTIAKEVKKNSKSVMKKVEEFNAIQDDREITQEEYIKMEQDQHRDSIVIDKTREDKSGNEALLEASSATVNEILFRQQRVLQDEDPDAKSDVVDELKIAFEMGDENTPRKDLSEKVVRKQLYNQYEKENPGKKAIFKGKETKGFKTDLDEQRAEHDPLYKEYKVETGILALHDEEETKEFKSWIKEKMKKDEKKD